MNYPKKALKIGLVVVPLAEVLAYCLPRFSPPPIAKGVIVEADWTNWEQGSRKFTDVLQKRFPLGTNEQVLRKALLGQGFVPSHKCHDTERHYIADGAYEQCVQVRDPDRRIQYFWGGIPCNETVAAEWAADRSGRITLLQGTYSGGCI